MKVKLDENVTAEAVAVFTDAGHDVHTIADEDLVGHTDAEVWTACQTEGRLLVTFDLGFGDVRLYPPGSSVGVVLLRLADQRPSSVLGVIRRLVAEHDLDALAGCLTVATETVVRLRRDN